MGQKMYVGSTWDQLSINWWGLFWFQTDVPIASYESCQKNTLAEMIWNAKYSVQRMSSRCCPAQGSCPISVVKRRSFAEGHEPLSKRATRRNSFLFSSMMSLQMQRKIWCYDAVIKGFFRLGEWRPQLVGLSFISIWFTSISLLFHAVFFQFLPFVSFQLSLFCPVLSFLSNAFDFLSPVFPFPVIAIELTSFQLSMFLAAHSFGGLRFHCSHLIWILPGISCGYRVFSRRSKEGRRQQQSFSWAELERGCHLQGNLLI